MKILYAHSYAMDSKMANCLQVASMCKALSNSGHHVILLTPIFINEHPNPEAYIREEYGLNERIELRFISSPFSDRRLKLIWAYVTLSKYVKEICPDFCFVRNSSFLRACLRTKTPAIYEVHNIKLHNRFPFLDRYLIKKLIRSARNKHLKAFLSISEALAAHWAQLGVPKEKSIALHDGFDVDKFGKPIDQRIARKELGLSLDLPIVVYTGTLIADRKIENILMLASKFPEVLFLVCGGPEEEKNYYEQKAESEGLMNIRFYGYVKHSKIPYFLGAANVLLAIWSKMVPTMAYCSPLKLFEYMAAERNIVVHDFPTIREVLNDGEEAYLADPESEESLVNAMNKALNQSYPSSMAIKASAKAKKEYTWDKRVNEILKFYGSRA